MSPQGGVDPRRHRACRRDGRRAGLAGRSLVLVLALLLGCFAALLVPVDTPQEAPVWGRSADPAPAIASLFDATAPDALAECVETGLPNSCSCVEACEQQCQNAWWNCQPDSSGSFAHCFGPYRACLDNCQCGECACGWDISADCSC